MHVLVAFGVVWRDEAGRGETRRVVGEAAAVVLIF
jgi:hypothetical protein